MRSIVLKRLATAIPSLVGVIVISFLLTRVLPGDTASYFAGPAATPQAIAEVRKQLGLDKSLPEQFARYVVDLAHGDLGNSLTTGQPVVTEIANRLPASGELTLLGLLIALGIAVPLGILAAPRSRNVDELRPHEIKACVERPFSGGQPGGGKSCSVVFDYSSWKRWTDRVVRDGDRLVGRKDKGHEACRIR